MKEDSISRDEIQQQSNQTQSKLNPDNLTDRLEPSTSKEWFKKKKAESKGKGESNNFFGKSSTTQREEDELNASEKLNSNVINSLKKAKGLQNGLVARPNFLEHSNFSTRLGSNFTNLGSNVTANPSSNNKNKLNYSSKKFSNCDEKNRVNFKELLKFQLHLDAVREVDLLTHQGNEILLSCSDDSVIKATNISQIFSAKNKNFKAEDVTCSGREDAFPSHSISAVPGTPYFVAGGIEGVVRLWKFDQNNDGLSLEEIDDSIDLYEVIWGLRVHSQGNKFLSCAANGAINCWGLVESQSSQNLKFSSNNSSMSYDLEENLPTVLNWVEGDTVNDFVVGIKDKAEYYLFDSTHVNAKTKIQLDSSFNSQIDKILSRNNLVYLALESGDVVIQDVRQNLSNRSSSTPVTFKAHKNGCTSLAISKNEFTLATSGADGKVKLWDLRNEKMVGEKVTHLKKYGEAVTDVKFMNGNDKLLSVGADGCLIIDKIF